ncbi:MAG TPA: hypothetical protein VJR92_06475 [Gemmatimonadaceae bacterium]|nr:hypothetical protein [Gemmatimonadaceae bacterium]
MIRNAFVAAGCIATLLGTTTAAAQTIPARTLTKPEAEANETFTGIDAVHEFKDGRVLVVDAVDRSVHLIDLATGQARKIGRRGSGPGEHMWPFGIVTLGGDSVGIADGGNHRILVMQPDGRLTSTFLLQFPGADLREAEDVWLGGSDSRGRLYAVGPEFTRRRGQASLLADSLPILRWTPGTTKSDTLAWFRPQKFIVSSSTRGGRPSIDYRRDEFAPLDQWAVAADGMVVVAKPDPYHMAWIDASGVRRSSPPIPVTPQSFTEAHKREWREAQKGFTTAEGDGGPPVTVPKRDPRAPDPQWPAVLPPFLAKSLHVAPDGNLWLRRTGPVSAPPTYDVINRQGRVVYQAVLPKQSRVVGFGAGGAVYVAFKDEDDVEHLQRYRLQ